jgi:hypothetical protein
MCVQCLSDGDCHQDDHCTTGICDPDVCFAGDYVCVNETTVGLCDDSGARFYEDQCFEATCVQADGVVTCEPFGSGGGTGGA